VYWYGKNIQGDIVAVYSSTGTVLMNYTYTAWGKTTVSYSNSGATTTAVKNNLTYRGYYYDSDLGMYYLQSRYYDPNTCRFINADSALYHSMLGYNLFVYCENTPITRVDPSGDYSVDIKDEDGNPLDDWLFNGGEGGGGYYTGPGSAYYNYTVYTSTSTSDAMLGGYHSSGLTSAMTNQSYYVVPNAVTVVDSMVISTNDTYTPPKGGGGPTSKIIIYGVEVDFGHGGRHLLSNKASIRKIERAIAEDVITKSPTHGKVGHGYVNVDGIDIYYNYFTRNSNLINVGTYRPLG
jgi:RHS repeat-associated protein